MRVYFWGNIMKKAFTLVVLSVFMVVGGSKGFAESYRNLTPQKLTVTTDNYTADPREFTLSVVNGTTMTYWSPGGEHRSVDLFWGGNSPYPELKVSIIGLNSADGITTCSLVLPYYAKTAIVEYFPDKNQIGHFGYCTIKAPTQSKYL